jgi:hypothetical protein
MFFRSLPSAIFLFSSITKSQVSLFFILSLLFVAHANLLYKANILPVIITNHTVTLAAELVRKTRALFKPWHREP